MAGQLQSVHIRLPDTVGRQQPVGKVPASTRMDLVIGLPLRHRRELTNFLTDIYRPGSARFRQYLTPAQFAEEYGPSEADYQAVKDFAQSHGLTVTGTHPNRTLLDVNGAVSDIEQAFHVKMNYYQHPTENRTFYAPDSQPSIDLATPVLSIGGLHNYTLPHPNAHRVLTPSPQPQTGSGKGGSYLGGDFRAAYLSGVTLTGAGQSVGLFELDGYRTNDIASYEKLASQTSPPLTNVLVDGFSGETGVNGGDPEVCLDIEMAISMAPGLQSLLVYEGTNSTDDILNQMATDDIAKQLSSSWSYAVEDYTTQIYQQFAAQGQAFFEAAGDSDAYVGPVVEPSDDPYITCVGGTELATTGPKGSWTTEVVWNQGGGVGTGGGISAVFPIPFWQQGVSMTGNGGSTTMRNCPDVAMVAYDVYVQVTGGSGTYVGTSIATPLWASLLALANQQGASNGLPPIGFANPAIYAVGQGANYKKCFHDILVGNNTNSASPSHFLAEGGYDLCTGWGTPIGSNLISALVAPPVDPLLISPPVGFTAFGPIGGPFSNATYNFELTNVGSNALNWSVSNNAPWLTISPAGGSLTPGGPAAVVTASLNSTATNSLLGDFKGGLTFTDEQDGVSKSVPIMLSSGNAGFETGDFSDWNFFGNPDDDGPVLIDWSDFEDIGDVLPNVPYSDFVHSGLWGAFLGETGDLGYLIQSIPTAASNSYVVSCWLSSYTDSGTNAPNEFQLQWNGTTLFDKVNMPAFGWTNLFYIQPGIDGESTLQIGFRDDPAGLGLDDIIVQAVPPAVFQSVYSDYNTGNVYLTWPSVPGLTYQLQYTPTLTPPAWANVRSPITATSNTVTGVDIDPSDAQRFYRFILKL